jgi:hypothetical protein
VEAQGTNFGESIYLTGDTITSGTHQLQFFVKPLEWSAGYSGSKMSFIFINSDSEFMAGFDLMRASTQDKFCVSNYNSGSCLNGAELISLNNQIQFTITIDFTTNNVDVEAVSGDGTFTYTALSEGLSINTPKEITKFKLYYLAQFHCLIDNLNIPVAEASVWASEPPSETEITSLDQNITINWAGLGDYDTLYLTFINNGTQITTDAKSYEITTIGESGNMSIALTDFNFEKNGRWYLKSVASYGGYLIESGMFLSGYGSQFTEDLTDGTYYLDINISGFEDIFAMSDFTDWYHDNVDRFAEPTDTFATMAGFLTPIFSYIGEFGNRISGYFNNDEANARGYEVGRSIPVFTYYVGQVAYFLGGFPLMSTFIVILLIMVGIFIFRLVIRFIPHFGS